MSVTQSRGAEGHRIQRRHFSGIGQKPQRGAPLGRGAARLDGGASGGRGGCFARGGGGTGER